MICWLMGWQKPKPNLASMYGAESWTPVVYGALPGVLEGEPCVATLVTPHKEEVTCTRCREAYKKRGANMVEAYLKGLGR